MIAILTWIALPILIFSVYSYHRYQQSRNKKLFFREGTYRLYPYVFGILILLPVLVYYLWPLSGQIDLSGLRFHSESVTKALEASIGWGKPWLQWLSTFTETLLLAVFSASFIALIWLFWLRRLDFFQQDPVLRIALLLLLGMFSTLGTLYLSYLINNTLGVEYTTDGLYNLFVYCWIGIGIPEELMKALPVLVLIRVIKVEEPLDILIYGSVSALGFALVENLLYLADFEPHRMLGRAFTAVVGHMFSTTIALYGVVLVRFHPTRKQKYLPILYFLFGALIHGFYDYLLFENFPLFFLAFFFLVIQGWLILINNAINNSPHFSYLLYEKFEKAQFPLAIMFCSLLTLSFVLGMIMYPPLEALLDYALALVMVGLPSLFFISRLNRFDLFEGYWRKFNFRTTTRRGDDLVQEQGRWKLGQLYVANTINPVNLVGKYIRLHAPMFNQPLTELFDIGEGYIEDRVLMDHPSGVRDPNWFIVQVNPSFYLGEEEFQADRILIKLRHRHVSLVHDTHIECWTRFIPMGVDPREEPDYSQYLDYGLIMINGHDYVYEVEPGLEAAGLIDP
ncbi:MAG TPA: hypothetical protein DCP28_30410 [Cytophagales bacterium]|nr:hypothetical protein [Cytophagales bacterium]